VPFLFFGLVASILQWYFFVCNSDFALVSVWPGVVSILLFFFVAIRSIHLFLFFVPFGLSFDHPIQSSAQPYQSIMHPPSFLFVHSQCIPVL